MKKITRFSLIAVAIVASASELSAQTAIDFETVGQDWAWTAFANGAGGSDNATLYTTPIANPSATGINTSANCAKFVDDATAAPWGGFWSDNLPDFTFTTENCIVKVMVYKNVISNFDVKFEGPGVAFEKLVPNTKTNEWEELTFDFTDKIGMAVTKLVIIPDFPGTRTVGSTSYFDNITFHSGSVPVILEPTVAALTPTVPAAKVISMFSNAYTNVTVDTWRTDWSTGVLTNVQIAGNDTKKYSNMGFVGIETVGANFIDATTMTKFHIDAWTATGTTLKIKLVDFGANAAWSGGDDVEHELIFTPTLSAWNSYDINLSDFTNLTTKAHMAQYILSCDANVFIDNVYFYNNIGTGLNSVENSNGISCYPNPVIDKLTVSAKSEINQVVVRNLVGQTLKSFSLTGLTNSINVSDIPAGNYFVTVKLVNGELSTQKFVK